MDKMTKINESSLTKIMFYKNPLNKFINLMDFYNIVFTQNGVYVGLKSQFGISFDLIPNMKYSNSYLDILLTGQSLRQINIPKPKLEVFEEILEMFKYVYKKTKWELCVNLYYDTKQHQFEISLNDQIVSGISAKYKYDEKFEMSERFIRYLQIHSHNSMAANFSCVDNNDENCSTLCYYGVIGKLTSESKFYNVDTCFRFWSGIRFINVDFEEIFEIKTKSTPLNGKKLQKLDKIIQDSKLKQSKMPNVITNNVFHNIIEKIGNEHDSDSIFDLFQ